MNSQSTEFIQVSIARRLLVAVLYSGLVVAISYLIMYFNAPKCFDKNQCTDMDQIVVAGLSVMDFVFTFIIFIMAIKGMLPGAKSRSA